MGYGDPKRGANSSREGCRVALSLRSCRVGDCVRDGRNAEKTMKELRLRVHDAFFATRMAPSERATVAAAAAASRVFANPNPFSELSAEELQPPPSSHPLPPSALQQQQQQQQQQRQQQQHVPPFSTTTLNSKPPLSSQQQQSSSSNQQLISVVVPPGTPRGGRMNVTYNGKQYEFIVPDGAGPMSTLQIQIAI
jgi:hypothetical protein